MRCRRRKWSFSALWLNDILCGRRISGHIKIHEDKVTHASAHHKQMENLMRTEIFVSGVKDGELQRIDHAAHRIENAACEKPQESAS